MGTSMPENKSEPSGSCTDQNKLSNASAESPDVAQKPEEKATEVGGRKGLDPVRYGDWEKGGRCIDF